MWDLYHVRGCAHKPVGQAACPCHACSSTCSPLGQAQAHPWLGRTQAASSPQSRMDFPLSDPTREPVGSGGDKFAWGQAAEWAGVRYHTAAVGLARTQDYKHFSPLRLKCSQRLTGLNLKGLHQQNAAERRRLQGKEPGC